MNTQASINCINNEMLSRLASGECSPNELTVCEEHVSHCQQCRDLLDSRAIDEVWNEQLLPAFQATECHDELSNRDAAQRAALNLLGPTDDPHMLGRIGSYEVVGLVGIGGMGIVFKAFDAALNRYVAIKMMQPHLAVSGAARQRFEREGRAAAAVISDFVLPIYAVSEWQGVPYLVMQYSAGMNLQKRLEAKGPLQLNEILRVAMQTARGLAAAHAQGLVHRDVKPSNILLDGSVERAMLTDFGLARAVDDASVTRTGLIAGTPQYMSPEQVRGDKVDARSDLFSLGSTIYTMCTGHPPFRAEASYAVLHRIVGDSPRSIREINADIPEWLDRIVMKLLSKSPCDRFESADQIAESLEGCLAHVQQPASVSLPEAISRVSAKRFRRGPFAKLVAVLALFSLMFAGVLIVLEMNKGTLTIECDADDIPIKIVQGEKVVETMTVSRDGKSTRIAAGKYTVEIDQPFDQAVVADGVVTISRGGVQVVKVKRVESPEFTVVSHKIESLLDTQATAVLIEQQMEPLIKLIRSTIHPDSWSSSQASIVAYPQNKSLVVRQTPAAQTAIVELLEQLKKQVADSRPGTLQSKSPSLEMKDHVDVNVDPQRGVTEIRGASKLAVERTAAVIDKIKEQQAAAKKQLLKSNPYAKLFDAIASSCNATEPTPIPKQLFIDCFKDRTKEKSPVSPPKEATFLFKSIKKVARSEQLDNAVTYEFDVDGLVFINEVVYLGTGDKTVAEDVLGGLLRDQNGPQIDAKKVLRENLSKRVKLTCDFRNDGSLDYLVEIGVIDVSTFMPIFQRFFESEPKYLANEAKDLYSLLQPSSNGTPSTTRFGATVFNKRLYWGSLEKVEQVREGR